MTATEIDTDSDSVLPRTSKTNTNGDKMDRRHMMAMLRQCVIQSVVRESHVDDDDGYRMVISTKTRRGREYHLMGPTKIIITYMIFKREKNFLHLMANESTADDK